MDDLEAACLSHDQCHSWTGGSFWSHKKTCDEQQRSNGYKICNYLKGVDKTQCKKDVVRKFEVHQKYHLSAGHYTASQAAGCG